MDGQYIHMWNGRRPARPWWRGARASPTRLRPILHARRPPLQAALRSNKLASVRIPEGDALLPDTKAELDGYLARLAVLRELVAAIEQTRLERIENAPETGHTR